MSKTIDEIMVGEGLGARTPPDSGPINVLIVDDEPKNLFVLESILNHPNYRLVRAESAEQALLALLVDEFALLILDIRMPGMTGIELARIIKERKKTSQVPIIFLTAYYNEDQQVLAGYDAGAVDYLQKPVNPDILRSKVAVFAELHRMQRELARTNDALRAEVAERRRAQDQLHELNDTLERRVAERTEHIRLLLGEVNHRSKNMLSVVSAIAHQMTAENQNEFVRRFSLRIQALAASHDLLARSQWKSVAIVDLVRAQLGHFEDLLEGRITLDGPPLKLSVVAAQCIGMVVNELATNAVKHGALSGEHGRVAVAWQIDGGDIDGRFTMSWLERSGPPVAAPERRGFGSTVIKSMAELSLDASVELDFASSGLTWRLACPTTRVLT
ncbi:MAG: response regulator [Alphaproteobacteria bacterium]|nr:response regulator [Alphaproteobacteria bacterium]MCW5739092.1 response regulator [Alphaproteobacteria bacterium]